MRSLFVMADRSLRRPSPTPVTDAGNGISGDFDSVSVSGLGVGTTFSYGIEVANINGTDVRGLPAAHR
jgi:hypothetical protein